MIKHKVLDFKTTLVARGAHCHLFAAVVATRDFETAVQYDSPLNQAFALEATQRGRKLAHRRLDIISCNIELILFQQGLKYFGGVCQKKLRIYSKVHKLLSFRDAPRQVRRKNCVSILWTIPDMVAGNFAPVAHVAWR